jgi:lipopolysaccharide transport system permease protein
MFFSTPPDPLLIKPRRGWLYLDIREIWNFRELLYFLTWRDVKLRYRQTLLGATWALLQPALTLGIFTLFFGRLARIPSDGIPYPLFALGALVPWNFFAHGLHQSSNSLIASSHLITKVYFPRILIPLSSLLSGTIDLLLSFFLLLLLIAFYGNAPGSQVFSFPAFLALGFLTALGAGLWLSALNVQFRDVRYAVPFLIQVWFFLSPIVYPSSLVPEPWQPLYRLNPMVGVVEGFRFALLGSPAPTLSQWAISGGGTALLLISGIFYFRQVERKFADII